MSETSEPTEADKIAAAKMAYENLQEAGGRFEDGENEAAWEYIFVARVALRCAFGFDKADARADKEESTTTI